MSSLITSLGSILTITLLFLTPGCSDVRNTATGFDTGTGKHTAGWLPAGHAATALAGGSCTECHGADLSGGIAGVSCTACHMGGPAQIHPASWTLLYKDHGPYSTANGTTSCANLYCHGTTLAGVQDSGPSCTACHTLPFDPASVICTACHQSPPNGTAFPNNAGTHAKHLALPNMTCAVCHNGAGGDTTNTYHMNDIADVFFPANYSSKLSTAAYNATTVTCLSVNCHGGSRTQSPDQANQVPPVSTKTQTPNWLTGSIDTATQCTACHVYGADEYNSYISGQHRKHVYEEKISCAACHDPALLIANHFATLNTTTVEGIAANTLRPQLLFDPTWKTCNPFAGGLTTGCHSDSTLENW